MDAQINPNANDAQRVLNLFRDTAKAAEIKQNDYLQEGENKLNLLDIKSVEVFDETFTTPEGKESIRKRIKIIRKNADLPLILPVVLHAKLNLYLEKGLSKVIIIKTGQGLKTKYDVIPDMS
jgi:hypothetical protein